MQKTNYDLQRLSLLLLVSWSVVLPILAMSNQLATGSFIFVTMLLCTASVWVGLPALPRKDLFHPLFAMCVVLSLYSLNGINALAKDPSVTLGYTVTLSIEQVNQFALACHLGIIALICALFFEPRVINSTQHLSQKTPPKTFVSALTILTAVYAAVAFAANPGLMLEKFSPFHARSYLDRAFDMRLERAADALGSIIDVLLYDSAAALVLVLATILLIGGTKSFVLKILSVAVIAGFFASHALAGLRYWVIYVVVLVIIPVNYHKRAITPANAFSFSFVILALMSFLSITRSYRSFDELLEALNTPDFLVGDLFDVEKSGELSSSLTFARLIYGLDSGETSYTYGWEFLTQIGAFIPRVLYPDRPYFASERFAATFDPIGFSSGGGFGGFIIQEGYWELGLLGVGLVMFGFGVLLCRVYRWLSPGSTYFSTSLYGILYYVLVITSSRSGAFGTVKAALITATPMVLLYSFEKQFSRTKR
jgi:hypothetical protein